MGWSVHETTLALSHQWPCRRHRWWAILCPKSWSTTSLLKWPEDSDFLQVGMVLPSWGCWPASHEDALKLTETELQAYAKPEYGTEQRLLTSASMAPTFLHSYGNALSPCPCGCRQFPFAEETLRTRGLRGCYVHSMLTGAFRFLDPMELAALLGFPATMSHLSEVRHALCLLGAVASPLQSLWTFSCFLSLAKGDNMQITRQAALEHLRAYKHRLCREYAQLCAPALQTPRSLRFFSIEGLLMHIQTQGLITTGALLQAEQFTLHPGEFLELWDGPRQLPRDQPLLTEGDHGPYTLYLNATARQPNQQGTVVIAVQTLEQLHILFLPRGTFLFEVLRQCALPSGCLLQDDHGNPYPLDFRVWDSYRFKVSTPTPPQRANGLASSHGLGLSDTSIWQAMIGLTQLGFGLLPQRLLLIHPLWTDRLLKKTQAPEPMMDFSLSKALDFEEIFCIFADQHHWALLWGHQQSEGISWTYLDGLCHPIRSAAHCLALQLSDLLQLPALDFNLQRHYHQQHPHTCGTVALWHLRHILLGPSNLDFHRELQLHEEWLQTSRWDDILMAFGRAPSDPSDRLANLLQDKGVPHEAAAQRAQDVLATLGSTAVTEALSATNPWATLKSLSSRPATRLRLVKDHELKDHINHQARTKHGAHVPRAKQKKQSSPAAPLMPGDPSTLQLIPNTFVDDDGDELQQIPFTEVCKDAHGVAFCTPRQAEPFLADPESISSTTLGLLITSTLPTEQVTLHNLTSMRFPALCTATDEPMLIQGHLLILSDGAIHRKEDTLPDMQVSSTDIVKIQVHKEEISMDWTQVIGGPIRAILQMVPGLRLCSGRQCGTDCPLYHPPLDDEVSGLILDIWARSFCNQHGKITKAEMAHYFQALLRVPSVALDHLLRIVVQGVYFEPRASTERGPHPDYSVIWLPGLPLDKALHRLRTCDHGLSLAKMHQRYGIRVKTVHEQQTHQALRPDDQYIAVQVKQVYVIFPLPHGLTHHQVSKLLEAWQWRAKPLQTTKGTHQGQGWAVGTDCPPPNKVMRGFDRDLLITLQKEVGSFATNTPVVASQRTKRFLKDGASSLPAEDPWHNGADPWAMHRPTTLPAPSSAAPARRLEQLQAHIREEVKQQVSHAPPGLDQMQADPTIQQLQVNITELQAQGAQFQAWFSEAGQRMTTTEQQLQHLHAVVEQQGQHVSQQIDQIQQEVDNKTQILQHSLQGSLAAMQRDFDASLDAKLSNRFDRIESMLAKKSRTEA